MLPINGVGGAPGPANEVAGGGIGPVESGGKDRGPGAWLRARPGDVAGWTLLGAFAFFLVSGGAAFRGGLGSIDAWVYTGYINDYEDLVERFGRTYYSARIAAIWPQELAYAAMGEPAYELVRWLLLMACGGALALLLRRFGSARVAYSAGLSAMAFPVLLAPLTDDYTVGVALAFVFVSLPLLASGSAPGLIAAGFALSLAMNANEVSVHMSVPVVVAFGAAVLVREGGARRLLKATTLVTGGALAAQVVLSLAMSMRLGWDRSNYFFQEASLKIAGELAGGLAENWAASWLNPYTRITTMAIAVTAACVFVAVIATAKRIAGRGDLAAVSVGLLTALGLVIFVHVVIHSAMVGTAFGIVWVAMPAFVAGWVAFGLLANTSRLEYLAPIAAAIAMAVGFCFATPLAVSTTAEVLWWVALTIVATCLVAGLMSRAARTAQRTLVGALGALVAVVIPLGPLTAAAASLTGYALVSTGSASEPTSAYGVHALARSFHDYVKREVPPGTPFTVYYPDSPLLTSVQSTVLWGYSCASCGRKSPFPAMPATLRRSIAASGVEALVLLTPSRGELSRAVRSATSAPSVWGRRTPVQGVSGGSLRLWAVTLHRK